MKLCIAISKTFGFRLMPEVIFRHPPTADDNDRPARSPDEGAGINSKSKGNFLVKPYIGLEDNQEQSKEQHTTEEFCETNPHVRQRSDHATPDYLHQLQRRGHRHLAEHT